MDEALTIPGVANLFTMPIKARIDMLSTGVRTPVGLKIHGSNLEEIERLGLEIEKVLREVPGTRSVYAERVNTGYYLDIRVKREEASRYGLTVEDVQEVVQSAIGGTNITTTIEGRDRYPVNVRYARDLRGDVEKIKRVAVPVSLRSGPAQVALGELAEIGVVSGPSSIKSEEGTLVSYVYIDYSGKDVGGYIAEAGKKLASLKVPQGYRVAWAGEYEYIAQTWERLKWVLPLTGFIIFLLLYMNTRSISNTLIVLLAVPFSLVGSFWLLYLLGYNLSTAVWVGLIALAGLDAETGVVMLLYLDLAHDKWKREGRLRSLDDLREAVMYGAVKRIRPKIMTVGTTLFGLIPILFSQGIGADVMKRIAAPMVGGVITSAVLELIIYPVIYLILKKREMGLNE
jgi:Cu(I)/Ag(I) efflux system membrane protein CusA/SilA